MVFATNDIDVGVLAQIEYVAESYIIPAGEQILSAFVFFLKGSVFSCSHLEYNNLTEVNSGSLYGLSSLTQLFLSNNSIARINPDGWKFCQRLREL